MNIQISVVIWTVICFVLLMLILKNLLFTPVLKVIDARKSRVENARLKKAEQEQLIKENEEKLRLQKEHYIEQKKASAAAEIERVQAESKLRLEEAQKKRLTDTSDYRNSMADERKRIIESATPEMKNVAKLFADKLISF